MTSKKFQALWVLLFAGLAACGGEFEDDGRVAFPLQISFTDPSAHSANFDLTYELRSPEGFLLSEGQLASNLNVLNGIPTVVDAAFHAKAGDSITMKMVAAFDGGTVSSNTLFHHFGETDVALELGLHYFQQEDGYLIGLRPYVPTP